MKKYDVVIVGGGPAGRTVVHALRNSGSGLSVLVIKDEPTNVNRCAVPYGITAAKPIDKYRIPNALITDFGADLLVDRVDDVDTKRRTLETATQGRIGYGHLVLATGARPWMPPIPGIEAANVTAVRSLEDLERLRELAAGARRAAVVGAGYIGIEVACVLRGMGLDLALVEAAPHILPATMEPEFVPIVDARLNEKGIRPLTGNKVIGIEQENGRATGIRLENADSVAADFIVLALGVRPNVDLAAKAGLKTSCFGIVVDDHLQTSADGVYAAGDCAEARSFVSGHPVNSEFGTNAVFMGRVVAANIQGMDAVFPGVINASASMAFDLGVGAAGLTETAARSAGFDPVVGLSTVMDRYPMMDGVAEIATKLVFDRTSGRLLGGSVVRPGNGAAQAADFLSLAIQMRASIHDIAGYQYATHPELAAKPSDNAFAFAARDAMAKLALPTAETARTLQTA